MAIDSRAKRASIAGFAVPFLLGVTSDATQPQGWRQAAAWNYYGINADAPVTVPVTYQESPRYIGKNPTSNLTDLLRRSDNWIELPCSPTISTPARLGNRFRVFLTEDCSIEPPNAPHSGQRITWRFQQPEAGGVTVTFNAAKFVTVNDLPIPVSEDAEAVSFVEALYNELDDQWELWGVQGLSTSDITSVTNVTNNYTLKASDHVIFVDTSEAVITLTLPAGVAGTEYIIKKYKTPNSVVINPQSGEKIFGATSFTMAYAEEVITIIFHIDEWEVINHHFWNVTLSSTPDFPIIMAHDQLGSESGTGTAGFGSSAYIDASDTRHQTIAPIDGVISHFRAEIDGTAVGNLEQWDFELYVNGVASGLATTIGEADTYDEDLATEVSVSRGDRLTVVATETGILTNAFCFTFKYTADYQPLFGVGGVAGSTKYGDLLGARFNGSATEHNGTLFPIAGTITNLYAYSENLTASGEEITITLRKWNGTSWDSTALSIVVNYDTDGTSKESTSSYAVSAGDFLQWMYEDTGTGGVSYARISAQFIPSETGARFISGCCNRYTTTDSDRGCVVMGAEIADDADLTPVGINAPMPVTGTASNLYVLMDSGPGATNKWITVALAKNGVASALAAQVTDPSVSNSDTSNTVDFTAGSDDIGISITNSGDTPDSKNWIAWGFKYTADGAAGDVSYEPVNDVAITSVSANYTVKSTNEVILVDTSSGDVTVTLLAAVDGRRYTVKKVDPANTLTIQPQSGELIDGDTTKSITAAYTSATVIGYGGDWYIE